MNLNDGEPDKNIIQRSFVGSRSFIGSRPTEDSKSVIPLLEVGSLVLLLLLLLLLLASDILFQHRVATEPGYLAS